MKSADQTGASALRVTIQDLRTARYCLAGVRPWFRRHGFDWQEFLESGIAAERLRATGDALVEPVIAVAERRAGRAIAEEPATSSEPVSTRAPEPAASMASVSVSATPEAGDGQ